jgi:hypothetical protein
MTFPSIPFASLERRSRTPDVVHLGAAYSVEPLAYALGCRVEPRAKLGTSTFFRAPKRSLIERSGGEKGHRRFRVRLH